MTPATANTSADLKLLALQAAAALGALLTIVYGFALILACLFGAFAVVVVILTGELPPVFLDASPLVTAFLFLGVCWALLQHWVADTKQSAVGNRLKAQIRAELPALVRHAVADREQRDAR